MLSTLGLVLFVVGIALAVFGGSNYKGPTLRGILTLVVVAGISAFGAFLMRFG